MKKAIDLKLFQRIKNTYTIPKPVREVLERENIKRVGYTAFISIFIQIYKLVPGAHNDSISKISSIILIIMSGMFLALTFALNYSKQRIPKEIKRSIVYLFWFFFMVLMTPYYFIDIESLNQPFNIILFLLLLVIMPIFTAKESIFIFSLNLLTFTIPMIIIKTSFMQFLLLFVINTACFLACSNLHGNYIDTMKQNYLDASTDYLTKIPNRRFGFDMATEVYEKAKFNDHYFAIVLVDIDFFKNYNDTFGHSKGDEALVQVANALKEYYADYGKCVSRFGGEEFMVVASSPNRQILVDKAMGLCEKIKSLMIISAKQDVSPYLTVSVGMTVCRASNEHTEQEFITKADDFLYLAKNQGRNRLVCNCENSNEPTIQVYDSTDIT